ncbi:hypothetical protein [Halpernia frigidisoli]|nr:hypothetical protein [Halpernia frigidisoli]
METATLKEINNLLKDASPKVLERTLGYIEGILTNSKENDFHKQNLNYQLSDGQMIELDEMEDLKDEDFISAGEFHKSVEEKYGF